MRITLDEAIRALIASSEYEDWPRGRVVFDRAAGNFITYADGQIFPYALLVCKPFYISRTTPFQADPHYRRARRLAEKPYVPDHGRKQ